MAGSRRPALQRVLWPSLVAALIVVMSPPSGALAGESGSSAVLAPGQQDSTSAAAASAHIYQFPSAGRQFREWAWNALGPPSIGGNLVGASWRQWVTDEPSEWGSSRESFAKRFGSGCLTTAIGETSLSIASAAMGQDANYYRSPRTGFGPRLWHAVAMTFMARTRDGNAVFSAPKTLSPFAGPLVTVTTVYPDRYRVTDGLVSGAYGLLITAGWNAAREFVVPTPAWGGGRAP